MVLFALLTFALLAFCHAASAEVSGQALAGNDGKRSIPAPLVFFNLTREEFEAKRLEHRGPSTHRRAVSDRGHIEKREPYLQEFRNNFEAQTLLELRNEMCVLRRNYNFRVTTGYCVGTRRLAVTCRHKQTHRERHEYSMTCPQGQECRLMQDIVNFIGNIVQLPYCANIIEINQRTDNNVDEVPSYQGHHAIPGPVQPPSPPHSPSALDNIDQFWEVEDGHIPGLTGQWDYHGLFTNGNGFSSRSFGMDHSWACIGCPAGNLYVETFGFKAEAVGAVFLSDAAIT